MDGPAAEEGGALNLYIRQPNQTVKSDNQAIKHGERRVESAASRWHASRRAMDETPHSDVQDRVTDYTTRPEGTRRNATVNFGWLVLFCMVALLAWRRKERGEECVCVRVCGEEPAPQWRGATTPRVYTSGGARDGTRPRERPGSEGDVAPEARFRVPYRAAAPRGMSIVQLAQSIKLAVSMRLGRGFFQADHQTADRRSALILHSLRAGGG